MLKAKGAVFLAKESHNTDSVSGASPGATHRPPRTCALMFFLRILEPAIGLEPMTC
jgi:hypothetical protein